MSSFKKVILLDLDGVLNEYSGVFDKDYIPKIKDGAAAFIEKLFNDNYEIKIFTTRNRLLVSKWLMENNLDKYIADVTNTKDLCHLVIDDRCICFNGNFDDLRNSINNFNVWWKAKQ